MLRAAAAPPRKTNLDALVVDAGWTGPQQRRLQGWIAVSVTACEVLEAIAEGRQQAFAATLTPWTLGPRPTNAEMAQLVALLTNAVIGRERIASGTNMAAIGLSKGALGLSHRGRSAHRCCPPGCPRPVPSDEGTHQYGRVPSGRGSPARA